MPRQIISIAFVGLWVSFGAGYFVATKVHSPNHDQLRSEGAARSPAILQLEQSVAHETSQDHDDHQHFSTTNKKSMETNSAPVESSSVGISDELDDLEFDRLRNAALTSSLAFQDLVQRFENTTDTDTQGMLLAILQSLHTPEAMAYSMQLTLSHDPEKRKQGYILLQDYSMDDPAVLNSLLTALDTEQDPQALSHAVTASNVVVLPPDEANRVIDRLHRLATHDEAEVRRNTVIQLARWDKSNRAEQAVSHALNDENPEVRQAAVWATIESAIQSDSVKTSLLNIANDTQEEEQIRNDALMALEQFQLNYAEYASYSQARGNIPMPATHDHEH